MKSRNFCHRGGCTDVETRFICNRHLYEGRGGRGSYDFDDQGTVHFHVFIRCPSRFVLRRFRGVGRVYLGGGRGSAWRYRQQIVHRCRGLLTRVVTRGCGSRQRVQMARVWSRERVKSNQVRLRCVSPVYVLLCRGGDTRHERRGRRIGLCEAIERD